MIHEVSILLLLFRITRKNLAVTIGANGQTFFHTRIPVSRITAIIKRQLEFYLDQTQTERCEILLY